MKDGRWKRENGIGKKEQEREEQLLQMRVKRFEDLDVWEESMQLVTEIYKNLKECQKL